jgi:hypothetical protein
MSIFQPRRIPRDDSGMALLAVLLAMALLTVIGAAITAIGIVEYKASNNHRSATRALLLADAGATHALALMRGPLSEVSYSQVLLGDDGLPATGDEGVLAGFGLTVLDALPDSGVLLGDGRYFVQLVNDAADPSGDPHADTNERLMAVCRGELPDGGRAEVRMILAAPSFPAIVANGDLLLPGNPDVLGPCAGVHANGTLTANGSPVVDGFVTATGGLNVSGTITDAAGNVVTPEYGPPVEIPDHDPLDYCGDADYVLRDGDFITIGPPPDTAEIKGPGVLGWKYKASTETYSLNGNGAVDGTYCVHGNAEISGNAGSDGDPLQITLLATGSVKVTGTPKLTADHPDGILIIAEGDVEIGGNASGVTPSYSGLVYAGAQCQMHGTPDVDGHVLCYDAPDPAGAADLTDENKFNGNPTVTYDCSGERRRTLVASWWEARAQ